MTKEEVKKYIEDNKPENKCKRCVWGKTLIDDKKNNVVNVMCMFPKCIKSKDKQKENKD